MCLACNVYGSVMMRSSTESVDAGSDEIHCYCNLPNCITTSYMCKSESGCFKKFEHATVQYGCLDFVEKKTRCSDYSNQTTNSSSVDSEFIYDCCFSDMCNNDMNDIHINEPDEQKMKELLLGNYSKSSSFNSYTNTEIWFRAVLIAVPICGLMVLVILIFIAVKMLRSDVPQNGRFTSTHLRKKFNAPDMNNVKIISEAENGYRSQLLPNCDKLEKKLSIVFKPQQDKYCDSNIDRYSNFHKARNSYCDNFEPPIHKKFSKQNLNILKLPYKFNELKSKNNSIYKNTNVSRKNCDNNRNVNDSSVVTIDSNVNYRNNYSLINNLNR